MTRTTKCNAVPNHLLNNPKTSHQRTVLVSCGPERRTSQHLSKKCQWSQLQSAASTITTRRSELRKWRQVKRDTKWWLPSTPTWTPTAKQQAFSLTEVGSHTIWETARFINKPLQAQSMAFSIKVTSNSSGPSPTHPLLRLTTLWNPTTSLWLTNCQTRRKLANSCCTKSILTRAQDKCTLPCQHPANSRTSELLLSVTPLTSSSGKPQPSWESSLTQHCGLASDASSE